MGHWLKAGLPAVLDLAHPAGWRLRYAATAGADYWAALSLDAPCPAATLGQERHSAEPRMT